MHGRVGCNIFHESFEVLSSLFYFSLTEIEWEIVFKLDFVSIQIFAMSMESLNKTNRLHLEEGWR